MHIFETKVLKKTSELNGINYRVQNQYWKTCCLWEFFILKHPFIKGVRNNDGIVELISELGAEITLEEKDVEEVSSII